MGVAIALGAGVMGVIALMKDPKIPLALPFVLARDWMEEGRRPPQ